MTRLYHILMTVLIFWGCQKLDAQKDTQIYQSSHLKIFINHSNDITPTEKNEWAEYFGKYDADLKNNNFYGADSVSIHLKYNNRIPETFLIRIFEQNFDFLITYPDVRYQMYTDFRLTMLINTLAQALLSYSVIGIVRADIDDFLKNLIVVHNRDNKEILAISYYVLFSDKGYFQSKTILVMLKLPSSKVREIRNIETTFHSFDFASNDPQFYSTIQRFNKN